MLYQELRRAHPSIIRGYYGDGAFANAMLPFCGRCSNHICAAAESFLAEDRPAEAIEKVFLPLVRDPEAERVTAVASTSPKTGVRYIEEFLRGAEEQIKQRHEALAAGTEKDAYLLILTPARELNYLNVGGARERVPGGNPQVRARPGEAELRLLEVAGLQLHGDLAGPELQHAGGFSATKGSSRRS